MPNSTGAEPKIKPKPPLAIVSRDVADRFREIGEHRPGSAGFVDLLEARALIHHSRAVVHGDRQRQMGEPLLARLHHEGAKERLADTPAPMDGLYADAELD